MKICLITTGQPSTNPRLVKEADAFSEAGHEVNVVAAHWSEWASNLDGPLLASRQWRMSLVDWRRHHAPFLFHGSRARHWLARQAGERFRHDDPKGLVPQDRHEQSRSFTEQLILFTIVHGADVLDC